MGSRFDVLLLWLPALVLTAAPQWRTGRRTHVRCPVLAHVREPRRLHRTSSSRACWELVDDSGRWGMGQAGRSAGRGTAAVAALAAALALAAPPAGMADALAPAAATHVYLTNYRNHYICGMWVLPTGADAAVLCYRVGGAPATPAEATACTQPARWFATLEVSGYAATGPAAPPTDFAVFSLTTATGSYGPAALATGETPPPFPAEYLASSPVTATALDLQWRESSSNDANGGFPGRRTGGHGRVGGLPGARAGSPRRRRGVHRGGCRPGGRRDHDCAGDRAPAGRDVHVRGPWPGPRGQPEPVERAHRHRGSPAGLYLAGGGSVRPDLALAPGARQPIRPRRRRTGLPVRCRARSRWRGPAFRPGDTGDRDDSRYAVRSPDGRWQSPRLPARWRSLSHLVAGPRGTAAAVALVGADTCVVARRPGHPWAVRRCLPPGSWVDGLVVDGTGARHVVYVRNDFVRSTETRYYATDARGRWTSRVQSSST